MNTENTDQEEITKEEQMEHLKFMCENAMNFINKLSENNFPVLYAPIIIAEVTTLLSTSLDVPPGQLMVAASEAILERRRQEEEEDKEEESLIIDPGLEITDGSGVPLLATPTPENYM